MASTKELAAAHDICVEDVVPPVDGAEPYARTARDVAIRTIVLQCVQAVGYGVDPEPVIEWLQEEQIWEDVSPAEQAFLKGADPSVEELSDARWRQEAQWALLWMIGRVEALGLPTRTCDTGRLVDEIMPGLGESIEEFVSSVELRPPAELLAEDDRVYNLNCYVRQAEREGAMPDDLVYGVLFQRHYAFEWLSGHDNWDDVRTDT